MQIELIETFLDLFETRSFNRTAERLGVTQSTVSGRIRVLEERCGRPLFRRSRAGTEPTTEGLRFESHARALRMTWSDAMLAVQEGGAAAMTLRLSIQHDVAGRRTGAWLACCRDVFPGVKFFVEADFSSQMCSDLMAGERDVAILYTPKPHPDLHFETLGEVRYRMVSDRWESLAEIQADGYVLTDYSPAFSRTHAALHPGLHDAPVVSGQTDTVVSLLREQRGAAYVLEDALPGLLAEGFRPVPDAPAIDQSVYVAQHLRNRHRRAYRRLAARFRSFVTAGGLAAQKG